MPARLKVACTTPVARAVALLLAASAFAQTGTVSFLHVNDVYEISDYRVGELVLALQPGVPHRIAMSLEAMR